MTQLYALSINTSHPYTAQKLLRQKFPNKATPTGSAEY